MSFGMGRVGEMHARRPSLQGNFKLKQETYILLKLKQQTNFWL